MTQCHVVLLLLMLSVAAVRSTAPKAPHLTLYAPRGGSVEITLKGYDPDGDITTARIVGLPSTGELHQLTQVYSDYGYNPKYDATSTRITSTNTVVTGSKRRVIYVAPKTTPPVGKWATFRYVVEDKTGQVSAEGIVHLVSSSGDKVLVGSDFSRDSEGWSVANNGNGGVGITYERTSHGSLMNYFIYSTDDELHIHRTTGDDRRQWYFTAPNKFLGSQAPAYGGKLQFSLGAFAGNFATKALNSQRDLVVLECKTCNLGRGMRFVQRNVAFTGQTKKFTFTLKETGGWLKDPKNTIKTWSTPTQCEMVEMLHNLSAIKILGDFTKWYESVGLDSVRLIAGTSSTGPPMKCLCATPGTKCI